MAKNTNLHNARTAKNDEFYTQLTDIEKEMKYYKDFFRGKTVYCNCDDARESNFFKYFSMNFEHLGLKKLICTGYKENGKGVILCYEGDANGNRKVDDEEIVVTELEGSGDFRSEECINYLKQADVVVTNPPFSLFREYVKQLMDYGKKFIIIGNLNAITYKEVFPLIKNNELWLGATYFNGGAAYFVGDKDLFDPEKISNAKHAYIKDGKLYWRVNGVRWFSNVDHKKRHEMLDLYRKYNPTDYPNYDNYKAIECGKCSEIPMDYDGVIGVPISLFDKYCPEQFEVLGITENADYLKPLQIEGCAKYDRPYINGKRGYSRLLIKRK